MEFSSKRLCFREFDRNEFEFFYSIFSNEQVMEHAFLDRFVSKEDGLLYFEGILENNKANTDRKAYEFGVYRKTNVEFIGFADIEIGQKNNCGGWGEIGYFVLPEFWGHGYGYVCYHWGSKWYLKCSDYWMDTS